MNWYLLPNVNSTNIESKIDYIFFNESSQLNEIIINTQLNKYLNNIKLQINSYNEKWDIYKKYTNPYEFIHTLVPNTKQSISKLKPLSRSFYKMIEICKTFSIMNDLPLSALTFHLAEGPGGFIEALCYLRNNLSDTYYGMTLQNEDINIPGWKKSNKFLKNNSNVIIENGMDQTGNLFNTNNFIHCFKKYKNSMNLITGDGGFDFSIDFNNQEKLSSRLIFAQICYAIALQKKGGTFILKVFDLFTSFSIDLVFLLCSLYKKVYIIKPYTSRYANSEKYLVCKDFICDDTSNLVNKLLPLFDLFINCETSMYRLLNIEIPYLFNSKLQEYNSIFGQQQIENILMTFSLIENYKADKIEIFKKHNIIKSIKWCQKNNIPYNQNIQNTNIFLNKPTDQESSLNITI